MNESYNEKKRVRWPLVSIVIPTFNSAAYLEICLNSIKNQTYKNIEIIIVDKNSQDQTTEIAKKFGAMVISNTLDRSAARNVGIHKTRGVYVLSVDSDMELQPRVVETCIQIIKNKKVGAVIIPERSIGSSYWVMVRDFERSFYAGTNIESARFFRKVLVQKSSGYNERVVFFEEATLPMEIEKMGYITNARNDTYLLHHEGNFSLIRWLKKKYHYGKTIKTYRSIYAESANKQLNPIYRANLFLKNKKFYLKPCLGLGVVCLKFLEFISIILGSLNGATVNEE